MTRKNTTIRQGVVTEMMTELANLPKREKAPDDLLTLPEIFREKEYMAEIKGALRRGYSFEDLAEIFTERCGVTITARQLKYHCTRERNLHANGRKTKSADAPKNSSGPTNSSSIRTEGAAESGSDDSDNSTIPEAIAPATGDFPVDRFRQSN